MNTTSTLRKIGLRLSLTTLAALGGCIHPTWNIEVAEGYEGLVRELGSAIKSEMSTKGLPALSIALIDGQEVVWAQGFGVADPDAGVVATGDSVYRVGSVSKLFTDIAMMQLVEEGVLDLDAPIQEYLPEFNPASRFAGQITLRQLTSHRSGLLREPPVGNYFEDSEPTLAETVASMNRTALVRAPGTVTKYSNAGIAVVGRVVEAQRGLPYAQVMSKWVLEPMGISGTSAFEPTPAVRERLAAAEMWSYDGRRYAAPTFQLGMSPAGSLYSSVLDLARFVKMVFAGGRGAEGRVLASETLAEMMTPSLAQDGTPNRFGIGFSIDELGGHKRCGHGGAVYGFATQLSFLPEEELGVVVCTSLDVSNTVTHRLATHGLELLLANRDGRELPHMPETKGVGPSEGAFYLGLFEGEGERARITRDGDRLRLEYRGRIAALRSRDDGLIVDDRHSYGIPVHRLDRDTLTIGGKEFKRVDESQAPPACPERWLELVGEYGWDHNTLFIREEAGRLEALIEWFWFDPLTEVGVDEYALPTDRGLYPGEKIRFRRDDLGRVSHAMLGEVEFARRAVGNEEGTTFKIEPVLTATELRLAAAAASPPLEEGRLAPDLVDVTAVAPSVRLDIRYATEDNFMGMVFYPEARALLQRHAAEALLRASDDLEELGYGLLVHDAYRPWHVTKMFWDATPGNLKHFVADPTKGSRHNRGCAVDLTLYELDSGEVVRTTGGYDEFSPRSYPTYPGGTARQRWYRDLLRSVMESNGFTIYEWEWWHYDYKGWRRYPVLDLSFAEALEAH